MTPFLLRFVKDIEETAAVYVCAEAGAYLLAHESLDLSAFEPKWREALNLARTAPRSFADSASFERFCREVVITRLGDRFTNFVAELLAAILVARPEILSDQKVPIPDLLTQATLKDAVASFAQRRADELSYGGFPEMFRFLTTKVGLELQLAPDVMADVTRALATRNAIVHNRGLVSDRYLRETGQKDLVVGSRVPMTDTGIAAFVAIAHAIDEAARSKFGDLGKTSGKAAPGPAT